MTISIIIIHIIIITIVLLKSVRILSKEPRKLRKLIVSQTSVKTNS